MRFTSSFDSSKTGLIVVFFILGLAFATKPAMAQVSCNNALSDSQNAYFNANFSAAIQILTFCIDQAIFDPFEEKEAYLLLSRVYFSVGQRENAEAAMEKVFELDALYVADPSFPPPLRDLVDEVRDRLSDEGRLGTHTLTENTDPTITSDSTLIVDSSLTIAEAEARRKRQRNLIYIGGGAAVAGTLAIILSGGGGGGTDPVEGFPLPPGRP